jgi:GntR family transcriptional regulator
MEKYFMAEEDLSFDKTKPLSLYYQLKEKLLKKIRDGEWKAGQKIPPETDLCALYGLSRITVRKSIEELVRDGYLVRFQGKGTFVASISFEQKLSKFYSFSEALLQKGKKEHVKMLSFSVEDVTEKIANHLAIGTSEKIFRIVRLRSVDDTIYALETSYIPLNICPALKEKNIIERGLYNSMRKLGANPQNIIEKIRADALRVQEAKQMKSKAGIPIIRLERTTFDGTLIIEYCVSIVRGDFFTYTVELKT